MLGPDDKKLITGCRNLKPITLKDRELTRLVSVLLHDLGHEELIPDWIIKEDIGYYYDMDLKWFTLDKDIGFDFSSFFIRCCEINNFRIVFKCLCELHKRRRKYAEILRTQPIPTMDQVARRGLLEYGAVGLPGLTSWLMWRKWIYDIDNRSAQETGYLFEPMLAASLGGRTYGSRNSPVTRDGAGGKGRQVDCIVDVGGERLAYEFKARVTIAASGQGRFAEELTFPADCRASGFTPMLLVMDPTPNEKLEQLRAAFEYKDANGRIQGKCILGDDVWKHVEEKSGKEIALFVQRYIKDPIVSISNHEKDLLDLGLKYRAGEGGDVIEVSVGDQKWSIAPRPEREKAQALDGEEAED